MDFVVSQKYSLMPNSLAYVEMRLILSRLLWNFDMTLADPNFVWTKQKAFIVWEKLPLMVEFKPVSR